MNLEIGKEYIINHCRKGTFCAKLLKDGEFITVAITKGRAHYISMMNAGMGCVGDHITIKKSFCTFNEVKKWAKN